jgi:hypothetical protein
MLVNWRLWTMLIAVAAAAGLLAGATAHLAAMRRLAHMP